jgi:all-trans-retinol 13,14-reductase
MVKRTGFREDAFDMFFCIEPPFAFLFPYGYDRIREKLCETFPTERKAIDEYLNAVCEQYHSVPYVNLDGPEELPGLISIHGPTLQEFLEKLTNNRLLKGVLSMHCFLYGVAPDEVSFANHAYVAGSYYESVSGIAGGGLKLAEAFEAQLVKRGVEIYRGQGASKILLSGDGTVDGIVLEDDVTLRAKSCVSTIHPHRLLEIVPDSVFRPAYINRLKGLDETPSACILYAMSSVSIAELTGSNIFVFPQPDFTFLHEDIAVEKRPMYITAAGEKATERLRNRVLSSYVLYQRNRQGP